MNKTEFKNHTESHCPEIRIINTLVSGFSRLYKQSCLQGARRVPGGVLQCSAVPTINAGCSHHCTGEGTETRADGVDSTKFL